MASTFLKDNFKSMKGSISEKEEELLKKYGTDPKKIKTLCKRNF